MSQALFLVSVLRKIKELRQGVLREALHVNGSLCCQNYDPRFISDCVGVRSTFEMIENFEVFSFLCGGTVLQWGMHQKK